jgi:hypothetical protein
MNFRPNLPHSRNSVPYDSALFPKLKLALKGRIFDDITVTQAKPAAALA